MEKIALIIFDLKSEVKIEVEGIIVFVKQIQSALFSFMHLLPDLNMNMNLANLSPFLCFSSVHLLFSSSNIIIIRNFHFILNYKLRD